jgi:hypothetical protein
MVLFVATIPFCLSANSDENQAVLTVTRQQLTLLGQLRQEWREQQSAASGETSDFQRLELMPLVGVDRSSLASKLGPPDFCSPDPDSCGNSPHWTYFFSRRQPFSVKSSGSRLTEVTVTAGSGWALEMFFSREGAVEMASRVNEK